MDDVSTQNRRRYTRQALSVPASLRFHEEEAPLLTLTQDVGLEGAKFSTGRAVEPGVPVLLRLQLGDGRVLECKAKVCWSRDADGESTDFGIRFLDLHEDEREFLRQFLESA